MTGTIDEKENQQANAGAPQFFTAPAEVPPKPQLACIGTVSEVGEVRTPEDGGKFHSVQVTLEPKYSGQKKVIFVRFWPEVFTTDPKTFTPDFTVEKGADKANDYKRDYYWCHKMSIVSSDGSAQVQGLVGAVESKGEDGKRTFGGPAWEAFIADVIAAHDGARIEPEKFRQVLQKHARGKQILYTLKQASTKTDDGEKVYKDDYEVSFIAPLNKETLASVVKRATKSAKQTDLRRRVELRFPLGSN